MPFWYINTKDLNKTCITDYFVTSGQTYTYTLYFRNPQNENKIIKKSQPFTIKAESGLGCELTSESRLIVENGKIDRIPPVPSFPKDFVSNTKYYNANFAFTTKENNYMPAYFDNTGKLSFNNESIPDNAELESFQISIEKDNV